MRWGIVSSHFLASLTYFWAKWYYLGSIWILIYGYNVSIFWRTRCPIKIMEPSSLVHCAILDSIGNLASLDPLDGLRFDKNSFNKCTGGIHRPTTRWILLPTTGGPTETLSGGNRLFLLYLTFNHINR